jgi:hypothetical protein
MTIHTLVNFCMNLQRGFIYPILNFTQILVKFFHSIICRFSKMKFVVIHLETWGSAHPCVVLWTPEYCTCFFVYGGTYMAFNAYTA